MRNDVWGLKKSDSFFSLVEKGAGVFKPISELGNANPRLTFNWNRLATVAMMKIQ